MGKEVSKYVVFVCLLVSLAFGGVSSRTGPDPAPYLDPVLLAQFKHQVVQTVILAVDPGVEEDLLRSLAGLGVESHLYDQLHMVAVVLPRDKLDAVLALPGIEVAFRNEYTQPLLSKSAPYIGATLVWNNYAAKGKGVTVLVVDTGVDGNHPDVRYGQNLIENAVATRAPSGLIQGYAEGVTATDADGHGTHVAGIVGGTAKASGAGDSQAGKYRGIAFEANLIGFAAGLPNLVTGESSFDSVSVLEAFNYALTKMKAHNIRVVSNSWGTTGPFEPQSPINLATLSLYRAGLVVVFAAGNEGESGAGSLNPYSVAPWVLSVAAGNYVNKRASFSSIGTDPAVSKKPYDHPDVMAPGFQITAARAQGDAEILGNLLSIASRGDLYASKSGTSMAAPHVSGVAALLLSTNPQLSPDEVYDVIVAALAPIPGVPEWEVGAGYLNALAAYDLGRTLNGSLPAFLAGNVKYAGKLIGDDDFSDDPLTVGLGTEASGALVGGEDTLLGLGTSLVTTGQGLTLVAGAAALSLLSFRFRRGPSP